MNDNDFIFGAILALILGVLYVFQNAIMAMSNALYTWMFHVGTTYGYIGAFIISAVGNSTIVLPVPYALIIVILAAMQQLDPLLLGIVAGLGSALGEVTAYAMGKSINMIEFEKRYGEKLQKIHPLIEKRGLWVIFLFGLTPLPDDLIMIPAGIIGYSFRKAIIACASGKMLLNIFLAYAGYYSISAVNYLTGESGPTEMFITVAGILIASYIAIRIDWTSLLSK